LKTGFRSYSGSTTHLYISGCDLEQNTSNFSKTATATSEKDNTPLKEELFVNLYPNPTHDVVTIESNEEIIAWDLITSTGELYKTEKVNDLKKIEVNFTYLNAGIYFIKIYIENGQIVYKKMIKQ